MPSDSQIFLTSTSKFQALLAQNPPEGLLKLIESGVKLLDQEWKTVLLSTGWLYTGFGKQRNTSSVRRTRILYVLTEICGEYCELHSSMVQEGYVVDTSGVDDEWLPFLDQILGLGDAADAEEQVEIEMEDEHGGEIEVLLSCTELSCDDGAEVEEDISDADDDESGSEF
jgi:hypothetical protein